MTRRRLTVLLALATFVLSSLGGLVALSPAADAVPTLTLAIGEPSLPIAVPGPGSDETTFSVTVTASEPVTNVTVAMSGDGLNLPAPAHLASLTGSHYFLFYLSATTAGLHSLTVAATADGGAFGAGALPYVWAPGSMLPGGGDLTGRTWGYQGYEDGDAESSVRDTEMISFVNDKYAYDGMPRTGVPTCTHATGGCLPYAYDPATGLVQVGNEFIGKVAGSSLYTDGFIPADEQDGELYSSYTATSPLVYAKGGRLNGHWRFESPDYPSGLVYEEVVFRRNGTYSLAFRYDNAKTKHLAGSYRVGRGGRLTLRAHGRVAQLGSLLSVATPQGVPQPGRLGIWLVLSGPHGHRADGNLLKPRK